MEVRPFVFLCSLHQTFQSRNSTYIILKFCNLPISIGISAEWCFIAHQVFKFKTVHISNHCVQCSESGLVT